uniref:Uncharacterized protein n=1 Tax=virus sp. ct5rm7 TaxID=2827298 RepID=A0A8S5RGM2_9VIRU|nr:MAG TPA: hypothetical protein [virus sp. ct5rm7]
MPLIIGICRFINGYKNRKIHRTGEENMKGKLVSIRICYKP